MVVMVMVVVVVMTTMVQVISLETNHAGEVFPGTQQEVRRFMEDKGYVLAATIGLGLHSYHHHHHIH